MSLIGAILKDAGVNSVTGGTDVTFRPDGLDIKNGIHLIDVGSTDFVTRMNFTAKYKQPTLNGAGYSKDKKTITLVAPEVLPDGSVVFDLIRIEREVHPLSASGKAEKLNTLGAQILFDTDFVYFWANGELS